jgi:hypothetical protein
MADRCLRPAQGIALRIARLDAAGATPAGATNGVVLDAFTRFGWAPEIEAGTELRVQNARGNFCLDRRDKPKYRWWNVALDLCFPDPTVAEILAGALLITVTGDNVGAGVPKLGAAPVTDYGASLELWTYAIDPATNEPHATKPYMHFAFPKTLNWVMGAQTIENGVTILPLTGRAIENPGWLNGPDNLWTGPSGAAARAVMWMEEATVPTPVCGYTATPAQV